MNNNRQLTLRPGLANIIVLLIMCAICFGFGAYIATHLAQLDDGLLTVMGVGLVLLFVGGPLIWINNLVQSKVQITDAELVVTQPWVVRPESRWRRARFTLFPHTRAIKFADIAKGSLTLVPRGRSPVPVAMLTMHDKSKQTIWLQMYATRSVVELADALEASGISIFRYGPYKKR